MHVFMFRLCYGLVTACEWDPMCSEKKREEDVFMNKAVAECCKGRRSSHEWQRGRLVESLTLLPAFSSPSLLHIWLLSAAKTISDTYLMVIRSEVASLVITFLLRTYLYPRLTPSFSHFLSLQLYTWLCWIQINALQGFFSLCQQVRTLSCLNNGGGWRLTLKQTKRQCFF